jgi:hypothetical protein
MIQDRNNVQSPIRAMYDYNPYEPQEMLRVISLLMQEIKLQYLAAGFPIQEAIVNNTEQRRFFRLYGRPYVEIGIVKDLKFKTQMSMNYERYQRVFTKPNSFLDFGRGDQLEVKKTDNGWDSLDTN